MTLLLTNDDVAQVLTMDDCLEVLEQAFLDLAQGQAANRPRSHTYTPLGPGQFYLFKSMDGSWPRAGVHALRVSSDRVEEVLDGGVWKRRKPPAAPGGRWLGLVLLFSLETTELLAIIQDGYLQRMRVGATSGLAARCLAPPDTHVAGLFGAGWQAGAQLLALRRVLPQLELVRVYSPNPDHRRTFARQWSEQLGIPVTPADDPQQAVSDASLWVAATNSLTPVILGRWLRPGVHVNSVQGHELDWEVLERADLIVVRDRERPTYHTAGGIWPREAAEEKRLPPDLAAKVVTLGEVLASSLGRQLPDGAPGTGVWPGRRTPQDITVFGGGGMGGSAGLGIQFAAVAARVYEKARAAHLGLEIPGDWFLENMKP